MLVNGHGQIGRIYTKLLKGQNMQSDNDMNAINRQGTILHVTPTEAAGFVEWALVNGVFDDAMKRVLQAYAESRRGTFASIKYWLSTHCNEMRAMENSCTPDENKRREMCGHKADKLDNVICQIDSMEQGTKGFVCGDQFMCLETGEIVFIEL